MTVSSWSSEIARRALPKLLFCRSTTRPLPLNLRQYLRRAAAFSIPSGLEPTSGSTQRARRRQRDLHNLVTRVHVDRVRHRVHVALARQPPTRARSSPLHGMRNKIMKEIGRAHV